MCAPSPICFLQSCCSSPLGQSASMRSEAARAAGSEWGAAGVGADQPGPPPPPPSAQPLSARSVRCSTSDIFLLTQLISVKKNAELEWTNQLTIANSIYISELWF
jgi:hypothetical protein